MIRYAMAISFSWSASFTLTGESSFDEFGWSAAGVGDVNADGNKDIIVSALARNTIYLIYGRGKQWQNLSMSNLGLASGVRIYCSGNEFNNVGMAVSSLGDFNNDRIADFAFSALTLTTNYQSLRDLWSDCSS